MRDTIERHDADAQRSGARIVHTCGFDSIPSDLGVLLLHEAARADGAGDLEDTTLVVRAMKGKPSGGTIASLTGELDDSRANPAWRAVLEDPYALSPDRAAEPDLGRERGRARPRARRRARAVARARSSWPRSTRASCGAATRCRAGPTAGGLRYREAMGMGPAWSDGARRPRLAGGVGALLAGLSFPPTRAVLDRVLPSPGEGPDEKARRTGFFKIDVHGRTTSGRRYVCHVAAQGDPGYAATAVMFGESALCLALDRDRLPARAGVLTPATAMGTALADRLRAAGLTLEVEEA